MTHSDKERLAWERFEQNGTVGAYLMYRAVLQAETDTDEQT